MSILSSTASIPPSNTIYIQNLNEKVQKQGEDQLQPFSSASSLSLPAMQSQRPSGEGHDDQGLI
jgi:hypothetical protein